MGPKSLCMEVQSTVPRASAEKQLWVERVIVATPTILGAGGLSRNEALRAADTERLQRRDAVQHLDRNGSLAIRGSRSYSSQMSIPKIDTALHVGLRENHLRNPVGKLVRV